MSHSMQGVYAPLPQSLSDSDSEKEVSMEPVFGDFKNGPQKLPASGTMLPSHHRNGRLFEDAVKVRRVKSKMSPMRRVAFALSIALCFLPIVVFLWILPCSDSNTCPVKISNWESELFDVEFKGDINLLDGHQNLNLALMYKGSFNVPKILKNGVMSFLAKNGAVAWDFRQENYPLWMNCSLIDVNRDSLKDCLVVDEGGLKAIEVVSGQSIWHAHSAQEKSIPDLSAPVKLEDFDGDRVEELLSVYQKKRLFVISGNDGKVILDMKVVTICLEIDSLERVNGEVRYRCLMPNETQQLLQISMAQIKAKYHDHSETVLPEQVYEENIKTFITGSKKLALESYGHCPHCHSRLTLSDVKENVPIKTWSYKNTYTTTPTAFDLNFSNTATSTYDNIKGFVYKIWEWHDTPKKLSPVTHVHRRSLPIYNETYHLNQVSESVVFVIFYDNTNDTINLSMTDIYVICNGPDLRDCQPNYRNQQNSLLIADLDHDDSLELISYYSTYLKSEENGYDNWHLVSKVKVFRLESELPKLFGNVRLK